MHEHTEQVDYQQFDWGDLIEGTKEQLQALGLGVGRAFPGEAGGPRFKMTVRDTFGCPVTVSCERGGYRYCARRTFPNWPERPGSTEPQHPFASGVMRSETLWSDVYLGTAAALDAAEIVRVDQLPGAPGMRKHKVTIFPDGSMPAGSINGNYGEAWLPGAKKVSRHSKTEFQVIVVLSVEERHRRQQAHDSAHAAWVSHVRSLPRPPRLKPVATAGRLEAAHADAKRDLAFQVMLSRIVHAVGAP